MLITENFLYHFNLKYTARLRDRTFTEDGKLNKASNQLAGQSLHKTKDTERKYKYRFI